MPHEWIETLIALAIFVLGCLASTVGWLIVRVIRRMDAMEERVEHVTDKHGREIRNTRTGISYLAGQLKLPEPRYDD